MIEKTLENLVEAWRWDEHNRAEALAECLRPLGKQALFALDQALKEDNITRQAAVFALGVLGTTAARKRLEEQLAVEEKAEDYDAASVIQVIIEALARIKDSESRTILVRRLQRMASRNPQRSEVFDMAQALWKQRHSDIIPSVAEAARQIPGDVGLPLLVLVTLLEKQTSAALSAWVEDLSLPIKIN